MKLENIKIVLVGTTHPGNIGAAARAMNNMCFNDLALVDPQCPVGEIAYSRASGANELLDNRDTASELSPAIKDCQLVVASSARRRSLAWPELSPSELAEKLLAMDDDSRAALVFGREHSGLNNDEIQSCNYMVCIPTNPNFSSLNLASAVQVLCYEIFSRSGTAVQDPKPASGDEVAATGGQIAGYFEHLQKVLEHNDFLDPDKPGLIMQRLRRLYLRSELSRNEVNILRGMLTAIEKQQR
jgi:tRNA (cytidine32/uridine32-2'-O)-methyltransferase